MLFSYQGPRNHKSLICDRNSKVQLSCDASFERSAIDLVVHKSIEAFLMPATLLCYHFKIA